jgi:dephospho-CoA kinase
MKDYNFDFVIENDGTLEELEEKVKSILMHLNLL